MFPELYLMRIQKPKFHSSLIYFLNLFKISFFFSSTRNQNNYFFGLFNDTTNAVPITGTKFFSAFLLCASAIKERFRNT